ncbi:spore coat protein U domain-containing protein [Pseudomonas fulva]|nr:spore coat protein U domain-containing protein [Pseudomonas fulva]
MGLGQDGGDTPYQNIARPALLWRSKRISHVSCQVPSGVATAVSAFLLIPKNRRVERFEGEPAANLENSVNDRDADVNKHAFAALLGLLPPGSALAADFLVEVRVLVERGCMLVNPAREVGAQALGRIDLGAVSRLDGPQAPRRGTLLGPSVPRLACNPDTPYQVRVDAGQHGGSGAVRFLAISGSGARPIPYRLYRDAAGRQPLMVDEPQSSRVPGSGQVDLPLYARLDKLAWAPEAGRYTDLLKVTVTW